jgi:hypothetical protein
MSVLDQMTAGVIERKAQRGTTLTPVGTEKGGPLAPTLPKDLPGLFMSSEALTEAAKTLREKAATLIEAADAIDVLVAGKAGASAPAPVVRDTQKAQEREADARVMAAVASGDTENIPNYEELQKAAQAHVFGDAPSEKPEPTGRPAVETAEGPGWECPDHGAEALVVLTSKRRNRKYRACKVADCGLFEKG